MKTLSSGEVLEIKSANSILASKYLELLSMYKSLSYNVLATGESTKILRENKASPVEVIPLADCLMVLSAIRNRGVRDADSSEKS